MVGAYNFFSAYRHYGFERETLMEIPNMAAVTLEQAESLEQLRWLGHGIPIQTTITHYDSLAIDTPEDCEKVRNIMGW